VWLYFLRWFEEYIKRIPNKEVIDATEGGARIKGTKIMTLKETIEKYCLEDMGVSLEIKEIMKNNEIEDKKIGKVYKNLKELRSDLDKVKKHAVNGIKYNEKMLKYYEGSKKSNINNIFKKLDDVDKKVGEYEKQNGAVNMLVAPIIIKTMTSKMFREKVNETEVEKGKRIAKRGYALYKGLKEAIDQIKPCIDACIKDFEESLKEDKNE